MAPPHHGLPDEIAIWEILVRLPPKALLRCRTVCHAWRRATSTRDFLLAHHARQPTHPILYCYSFSFVGNEVEALNIIPFGHQAGLTRLGHPFFRLLASCDGLILLAVKYTRGRFSICNPATRQYAPLPLFSELILLGTYPHSPTGEYRLLLAPRAQDGFYIYTLGSGQPPRHIDIDCPDVEELIRTRGSVLFRGCLHWYIGHLIIVFETSTELFRKMHSPVAPNNAELFELDGMLGMSSFNDAATTIDIWMMQDFESEVWALKYRVKLPVAELTVQFGKFYKDCSLVVTSWSDLLVLVKFGEWLLHVDMDGMLVASFHHKGLGTTQHRLKQTLVEHTFFPTLEGYVVNASPFI